MTWCTSFCLIAQNLEVSLGVTLVDVRLFFMFGFAELFAVEILVFFGRELFTSRWQLLSSAIVAEVRQRNWTPGLRCQAARD